MLHQAFETYLYRDNKDGSGKASSYLKALEWLHKMLQIEAYGFEDALDLWSVHSVERLIALRERVLEEQKKGSGSPWVDPSIAQSYLAKGHCSAALTQLIEFLPEYEHSQKALEIFRNHQGDESSLVEKLNRLEPEIPSDAVHDPNSKDGRDRLREVKTRLGQKAFREVIMEIYQNRCALTGLGLPALNRASHIIPWAESKDTRMDPRNGISLSATYDAAFDRHLITFDEEYRLVLSPEIKERVTGEVWKTFFGAYEGQRLHLPPRYQPSQKYLAVHREQI